ncbi:hypothetical protein FGADI_10484 [Fusarium gaditjirri]|uniref:Uncharacterized protein n=1 Tax=Fusarium gaditjirri TaxID=282569 RepID=A0A8H4SX56_9HYPO|nr:hypothetical protein FGADI_10484 [Fusarium gaditjirri]
MSTASAEKPDSGANVDICKVARQIQHLAHFLSQGPPFAGIDLTDDDLKVARVLSPVTEITSHRRPSELKFPREWVEEHGALAIALRDWRQDVNVQSTNHSNAHAVKHKPAQFTNITTEAIEIGSEISILSRPMQRESYLFKKTEDLEKKVRKSEQEKLSVIQHNLKLQLDMEALQRKAQAFHKALFDPDNRIHETNVKAKVKLHSDIRQLQKSLDAANSNNHSLVEKNKDLESSNKNLVGENEKLVKKTQILESGNKALVTENQVLIEEIKDLDSDNETLITMSQDLLAKIEISKDAAKNYQELLAAKNQALESSNKVLVTELTALKTSNKRVVAECSQLKQRFEQSVIVTESCKERLGTITAKINELESGKAFLAAQNNDLMARNAVLGDVNKRLDECLEKIVTDMALLTLS